MSCRITGPLDLDSLNQAMAVVLQRHEICRTVFKKLPGFIDPVQIVLDEIPVVPEPAGMNSPDHAGQSSPVSWEVRNCGPDQHELKISFPALVADEGTLVLIVEELARALECTGTGQSNLDEPMQYPDYGQWQVELQSSSEARPAASFWKERLGSANPQRGTNSHSGVTRFLVDSVPVNLPAGIFSKVAALADDHGGSEEAVCLGAWTCFCARLSGDPATLIGVHSSGRTFEELATALGPYDRYLPIKVGQDENFTPGAFVAAVARELTLSRQYQEFYAANRATGQEGAFEYLFRHCTAPETIQAAGLAFEVQTAECHSEPFMLKLEVTAGEKGRGALCFNSELVSREFAEILAARFSSFFEAFVTDAKALLHTLPFTSPMEEKLVLQFSRSNEARLDCNSVIEAFQREAAHHPQRPAVICDDRILTYGDLDRRANQVANHLLMLGVGEGMPVALCAERSFEMVVGLLGIQKAGGAYVPLDPGYPKDRLAFVLNDCGAPVLLVQPHLNSRLPENKCKVLALSDSHSALLSEQDTAPAVPINPSSTAYIIYTSGSTGQPKGVPITHQSLARSTAARFEYYKEPVANYLLLSSFAFDSSIAGIFWSLSRGGTLTIPSEGAHQDLKELRRLIRTYKASHLLALPSLYKALLDSAADEELSSLKTAIVAGEACPRQLVAAHYRKLPGTTLYNEYGPTEATVWSTVHCCRLDEPGTQVPIGRPVPNLFIYIVDANGRPAGIGQVGEIQIGGPTLTAGYWNRPELTAEKFVPNPFEPEQSPVVYRTGDLGAFRMDGTIEFHGRIDQQVKIRGFRIEIGEIETILSNHPSVREVLVEVRDAGDGDKRLVAFLEPRPHAHISTPDLRLHAQSKLPQYMVPAQFVVLQSLPRTPNGKLDRNALPSSQEIERGEGRFVAPRNPDEETLAKIWADVLKLEKVGAEENFFDLGGHSLLAIQVIARVRDSFKVELPMAAFFNAPTVAGLAQAVERCRSSKSESAGGIKRISRVTANEEILARLNGSKTE